MFDLRIYRKRREIEEILLLLARDRRNIIIAIGQEDRHLPPNGVNANIERHGLDLHFQGHEFSNVNISQAARDRENAHLRLIN